MRIRLGLPDALRSFVAPKGKYVGQHRPTARGRHALRPRQQASA